MEDRAGAQGVETEMDAVADIREAFRRGRGRGANHRSRRERALCSLG